jgi:hypothetical protein
MEIKKPKVNDMTETKIGCCAQYKRIAGSIRSKLQHF